MSRPRTRQQTNAPVLHGLLHLFPREIVTRRRLVGILRLQCLPTVLVVRERCQPQQHPRAHKEDNWVECAENKLVRIHFGHENGLAANQRLLDGVKVCAEFLSSER
jgi:hypothetical protein